MVEGIINDAVKVWAEEIACTNQYFIFEIGCKDSRLSVVDLSSKEELYSTSIDTPKYRGSEKLLPTKHIVDSLLDKLVLEEAGLPAAKSWKKIVNAAAGMEK